MTDTNDTEQLTWRKASASAGAGQCVELAALPDRPWTSVCTSSGNCIEATTYTGGVAMRDSKDPHGPVLRFAKAEIAAFIDGIKRGEFDDLAADGTDGG